MKFKTPLQTELARIRRKLQLERLLKGLALLLLSFLAITSLASLFLSQNNFSDQAIFWSRLLGGISLVLLALAYVLKPILRTPSDRRVARFLEERFPGLHNRLSTAVELIKAPSAVHPEIRRLVQQDAARKLQGIERPRFFHRKVSLISIAGGLVTGLVLLFLLFSGPAAYRYSLNKLLHSWYDDVQAPLYSIAVHPGDVKVIRHADVEIRALLTGFDSRNVSLHFKHEKQPAWEEVQMHPDPEGNEFLFLFFDAREQMDYYVEADGIRSDTHTISVSEVPSVDQLQVELQFPRYTGLPPRTQKDDGDIRVLQGTEATLTVTTDQPVQSGVIRFEERAEMPLEVASPKELSASFKIDRDDYYRIHLQNEEGVWNPSTDEFVIEALIDQPPSISLVRPGRDQRVTNLEEVFTEVKSEDDYGLRSLRIHYSVNGQPDQIVDLQAPRLARSVTASHTFYLEEFELLPGDFISYYGEASDSVSAARTDIYFLEVQPYDRQYFQSQQSGGAAGGGGEDLFLSRTQKEIISATFNITREKVRTPEKEFVENVQTVAAMQRQLRQQAQTIVERIQRRGLDAQNPMFRSMIENLTEAMQHMEEASRFLAESDPQPALTPEQKSYQQLLRAESLFKEIQISMGGGSSGGGGSSAQELADMVDLELDEKKNQYETLQQNRQQTRDEALDEAARKLKELAQRQQQENERRLRQSASAQNSSGGSGSQQQLIEDLEEMARQLERLSREERDQQLNEISRNLRQAARDLQRSQSNSNSQQAQMQQQRALERLQQARDALSQQLNDQMSQSLQQLARQSESLARRQQEVVDQVEQLEAEQQRGSIDEQMLNQVADVERDKRELQEDVQRLESDLHQTARRLGSKEPEASRQLKQAGNDVRDQRIPEKMAEGSELLRRAWASMARAGEQGRDDEAKFWTDLARQREESAAEALKELAENVQKAEQALGQEGGSEQQDRTERALGRLGNLVEDLESLSQRASSESSSEGGEEPQANPSPNSSQQDQPAQQGESQGSAGREGEPSGGETPGTPGRSGTQSDRMGEFIEGGLGQGRLTPQQMRREWQERVHDAEQIRDLLRRTDPLSARDIAALARRMRQLDAQRILDDPEEVAKLRSQIIDGFRDLELRLHRSLKEDTEQLQLAHEDEVPAHLRKYVEEYYRSLATKK